MMCHQSHMQSPWDITRKARGDIPVVMTLCLLLMRQMEVKWSGEVRLSRRPGHLLLIWFLDLWVVITPLTRFILWKGVKSPHDGRLSVQLMLCFAPLITGEYLSILSPAESIFPVLFTSAQGDDALDMPCPACVRVSLCLRVREFEWAAPLNLEFHHYWLNFLF